MAGMSGRAGSFVVVVEPADQPTLWNNSPLRWLDRRRQNGYAVTIYERGLSFPRYREHLTIQFEAETRAGELRAVLRKRGTAPRQPLWRRL